MKDSDFEFVTGNSRGYYEGFGAFMWMCISVSFGLLVAAGAVLIHAFC